MEDEMKLVSDAIGGDRIALQQLLLEHTSTVRRFIAAKIPTNTIVNTNSIIV